MVAAYFGILHFYGVPYGVVGVLLAGFLGWLLAKSMLETRGLFWAWFIHFWQDVWIFSFMAVGLVVAGGASGRLRRGDTVAGPQPLPERPASYCLLGGDASQRLRWRERGA